MENLFEGVKSISELEQLYMDLLKEAVIEEEIIEEQYRKAREKLLENRTITGSVISEETQQRTVSKVKKRTLPPNEKLHGQTLLVVRGNAPYPYITPDVITTKNYEYHSITQDDLDTVLPDTARFFRDYVPTIEDSKVMLHRVEKNSQVVEIETDILNAVEDGEEVELKQAYFTKNMINSVQAILDNIKMSFTIVETFLINPITHALAYRLLTAFAIKDGDVVQIPFTVG